MDPLTDTEIKEFLAGSLPRDACRQVVRHLLRGCARSEGEEKPTRPLQEASGVPPERFRGGWLIAEALLRLSYEARFRDPGAMRQLAARARLIAKDIDPEAYPPGFVYDLQVRTRLELANAYRV